jgi:hypothetical protein
MSTIYGTGIFGGLFQGTSTSTAQNQMVNLAQAQQNSIGLINTTIAPSYTHNPQYHPMPPRTPLTERIMLAVYRGRFNLGELAKQMPGDYDKNRKLLGDIFLTTNLHMTLDEAASLGFVLREEVGSFIEECERAGALLPGE